jgi:hypothetical protein
MYGVQPAARLLRLRRGLVLEQCKVLTCFVGFAERLQHAAILQEAAAAATAGRASQVGVPFSI